MTTPKKYFDQKNILYEEKDTQLVLDCPFCDREDKLYIGKINGKWDCKVCGKTGAFPTLKKQFESGTTVEERAVTIGKFSLTDADIEKFKDNLKTNLTALKYLTEDRKLSLKAINKANLGCTEQGDITIPHYKNGDLVGLQYRHFNRYYKYSSEAGSKYAMFNEECLDTATTALVCEGYFDGIAGMTYGFDNVIAIPGCSSKKEYWIQKLKKLETVYIVYDSGEGEENKGQRGAYELARSISLETCKKVELPYNDLNDCLVNGISKEEIIEIVKSAKNFPVPGMCTLDRFEDELVDYIYKKKGHGDFFTGYENLDEITKGFSLQELRIVSGVTGAGKTTWTMFEMANYADKGIPVGIFSLESPIKKIGKDLIQSRIDVPLDGLDEEDVKNEVRKFKALPMYYFDSREFNKTLNIWRFRETVKNARDSYGLQFVVLDDAQFLVSSSKAENTAAKITEMIAEMKLMANTLNIHLIVIAHVNRENDGDMPTLRQLKGSSGYEQLTDYAMFIHRDTRPETPPDIAEQVKIAISKNRTHGSLGVAEFRYDKDRCIYLPE